jgi:predicted site-specific integrase-resolvase
VSSANQKHDLERQLEWLQSYAIALDDGERSKSVARLNPLWWVTMVVQAIDVYADVYSWENRYSV